MKFIKNYFINKKLKKLENLALSKKLQSKSRTLKEWSELIDLYSYEVVLHRFTEDEKNISDINEKLNETNII